MTRTYDGPIYDGDGHVLENREGILARLPAELRASPAVDRMRRRGVFPELDNYHSLLTISPEGSFSNPDEARGWSRFMDELRVGGAVLYPTDGLAVGRMVDLDQAVMACAAYNDWIYQEYLRQDERLPGGRAAAHAGARDGGARTAPRRRGAGDVRRDAPRVRPDGTPGRAAVLARLRGSRPPRVLPLGARRLLPGARLPGPQHVRRRPLAGASVRHRHRVHGHAVQRRLRQVPERALRVHGGRRRLVPHGARTRRRLAQGLQAPRPATPLPATARRRGRASAHPPARPRRPHLRRRRGRRARPRTRAARCRQRALGVVERLPARGHRRNVRARNPGARRERGGAGRCARGDPLAQRLAAVRHARPAGAPGG